MEIKIGDRIKFWSVKDTVIKINGDFVDTYSYVNVPLCECKLVIKKKKTSKKAIKVIKEFSLLVDKLIELKKLENQNPTIVNIRDIKGKTFQDILDELKPSDIINSIKEQIKEPVKSRFQQKLEEAMKQSLEDKEKK